MKIVKYIIERNNRLYDMNTMKSILGVNKSKLQRDLKKIPEKQIIKYKNQYLFGERTLLILIENLLFERLDKMKIKEDGLQKDKSNRGESS